MATLGTPASQWSEANPTTAAASRLAPVRTAGGYYVFQAVTSPAASFQDSGNGYLVLLDGTPPTTALRPTATPSGVTLIY